LAFESELTEDNGGGHGSSPFFMGFAKVERGKASAATRSFSAALSLAALLLSSLSASCQPGKASTAVVPSQPTAFPAASAQPIRPPLSGWELCYNAWDDNENGLIDEGCGVVQAPVEVLVAWDDNDVDLDLMVFDPEGEVATYQAPTGTGLSLDMDCPGTDECGDQPFEVVHSVEAEYAPGTYRVLVLSRRLDPDKGPLVARLGIRTPETTYSYQLRFYDQTQSVDLDFVVAGPTQKN
jgi:tRNA (guanosine-2'-O-)-methyltransferase